MSDYKYKNPGGYKFNGRKMNSGYSKNIQAEIDEANRYKSQPPRQQSYHNQREGIPINPEAAFITAALVIGGVGFGLYWIKGFLSSWSTQVFPWNFVVGYYNLLFGWPLDTFPKVWGWLMRLHLTPYSVTDTTIAVVGIFFYGMLMLGVYLNIYTMIMARSAKRGEDQRYFLLTMILLAPIAIGGILTLIVAAIAWVIQAF